ncbi:MAG: phage integrase SAM-like domain-containing protein [Saprospirales bacterium]|nr:phage integrase SAM-like domain-containing protein [Saprospirales bacterium]
MANVRFNLKNKQDDPALILMILRVKGFRFVYSTGQKVPLKYWDDSRGRIKSPHLYRPGAAINTILGKIEEEGNAFYAESVAKGKGLDWRDLRLSLDKITMRSSVPDAPVSQNLVEFIEEAKEKREQSKGFKENTIKSYVTLINHLKEFSRVNDTRLPFAEIDLDFFYSFTEYLFKGAPGIPGLATNTVAKSIQMLKSFLSEAQSRGIEVPTAYKGARFRVATVPTFKVYISEKELEKIEELSLPEGHRLERIRDLFLLSCWTGSDTQTCTKLKRQLPGIGRGDTSLPYTDEDR